MADVGENVETDENMQKKTRKKITENRKKKKSTRIPCVCMCVCVLYFSIRQNGDGYRSMGRRLKTIVAAAADRRTAASSYVFIENHFWPSSVNAAASESRVRSMTRIFLLRVSRAYYYRYYNYTPTI